VVDENMFVTAGDTVTVLNAKDVVVKSFNPSSQHAFLNQQLAAQFGTGSSAVSIIDDSTPPKYS
jgi:hypothetical protein